MTLLQMSYILEVDRCGSMNRAARNLFLSQSALSAAIAEVERELRGVPGVDQVVVFGTPDDEWGQAVTAVIVPEDPQGNPEALAAAVIDRATQALAAYKRPKRVLVADALPVSSTGKLRRSTLADDLPSAP